jgi:F-type H+-transporting ATPase subunit alpha
MSDIKPAEVSAILKKQLSDVDLDVELEEVGTVLTVGDGIARVYGLNNAQSGELVESLLASRASCKISRKTMWAW